MVQGNDWYYVGGAAIGGALLGALGQRVIGRKSEAGQILVIGRTYVRGTDEVNVDITADFDKGGYTVALENEEDWEDSRDFAEVFKTPEQAAAYVDEAMEKMSFKPEGGWLTYLELKLDVE